MFETITTAYPELSVEDFGRFGFIELRDDSDGEGIYLAKWDYSKPIPKGLKLGK